MIMILRYTYSEFDVLTGPPVLHLNLVILRRGRADVYHIWKELSRVMEQFQGLKKCKKKNMKDL